MTEREINRNILELHNSFLYDMDIALREHHEKENKVYVTGLVPVLYPEFKDTGNKLLFVGINPSFRQKQYGNVDASIFE